MVIEKGWIWTSYTDSCRSFFLHKFEVSCQWEAFITVFSVAVLLYFLIFLLLKFRTGSTGEVERMNWLCKIFGHKWRCGFGFISMCKRCGIEYDDSQTTRSGKVLE